MRGLATCLSVLEQARDLGSLKLVLLRFERTKDQKGYSLCLLRSKSDCFKMITKPPSLRRNMSYGLKLVTLTLEGKIYSYDGARSGPKVITFTHYTDSKTVEVESVEHFEELD